MRRLSRGCLALALITSLAACGGGGSTPASSSATSSAADQWETTDCDTATTVPSATSSVAEVPGFTGLRIDPGTGTYAPTIAVEKGFPPATSLVSVDLVPSTKGNPVTPGSKVAFLYCSVGQASRGIVKSTFTNRDYPLTPMSELIPGLQEGLVGMREGGRRLLVIPADKAYGNNPPAGSGVAPGETLIYVVELANWQP